MRIALIVVAFAVVATVQAALQLRTESRPLAPEVVISNVGTHGDLVFYARFETAEASPWSPHPDDFNGHQLVLKADLRMRLNTFNYLARIGASSRDFCEYTVTHYGASMLLAALNGSLDLGNARRPVECESIISCWKRKRLQARLERKGAPMYVRCGMDIALEPIDTSVLSFRRLDDGRYRIAYPVHLKSGDRLMDPAFFDYNVYLVGRGAGGLHAIHAKSIERYRLDVVRPQMWILNMRNQLNVFGFETYMLGTSTVFAFRIKMPRFDSLSVQAAMHQRTTQYPDRMIYHIFIDLPGLPEFTFTQRRLGSANQTTTYEANISAVVHAGIEQRQIVLADMTLISARPIFDDDFMSGRNYYSGMVFADAVKITMSTRRHVDFYALQSAQDVERLGALVDDECSVCLQPMDVGDLKNPVVRLPQCSHALHRDCAIKALKFSPRCPMCRKHQLEP
jgi:hypothetical protein